LVAEGEVGYVEFFDVVSSRRSVRTFTNDPITEDQLNTILEAVNAAPSAGNLQAFEVVVVRDDSTKKKIAKAAWGQNFIAEAPVCLVFLANPRRSEHEYGVRGRELYCIQDATIAAEHAHLSCVPLGLSSVWVGAYSEEAVAEAVSAPPYMRPVCVLPIGHPAETPAATPRRRLDDLAHDEKVGKSWPDR
jgi:nitroreductase